MIDRPTLEKPTAGACCRCGAPIAGDDIFHWSPGSWSVWCFPCYKAEHFHNLVRIQQRSKERRANLAKGRLNAIEVKLNVKRMHGAKRAPRTVIDESVMARVVEIYNANPGNANKAVALAFGVSLPGARERIKKARNLGLLPPSPEHYRNRKKRGNV